MNKSDCQCRTLYILNQGDTREPAFGATIFFSLYGFRATFVLRIGRL